MMTYRITSLAPCVAALVLLAFAAGCDRDETASAKARPTSGSSARMADKEYVKQLRGHITDQKKVAKDIAEIERRMDLQRQRARSVLPENSTDEQVLAEIEAHPTKYPQWRSLKARHAAATKMMEQRRAEARASVLARIARERDEQQVADAAAK